jgi:hypothetical protein
MEVDLQRSPGFGGCRLWRLRGRRGVGALWGVGELAERGGRRAGAAPPATAHSASPARPGTPLPPQVRVLLARTSHAQGGVSLKGTAVRAFTPSNPEPQDEAWYAFLTDPGNNYVVGWAKARAGRRAACVGGRAFVCVCERVRERECVCVRVCVRARVFAYA